MGWLDTIWMHEYLRLWPSSRLRMLFKDLFVGVEFTLEGVLVNLETRIVLEKDSVICAY